MNNIASRLISSDVPAEDVRIWLRTVLDSSDEAIISTTIDNTIVSWNRAAERLYGYHATEAVGRQLLLIVPDDCRHEDEDVLARLGRGERIEPFQTVRQTKDGRRVAVSLAVSPITDVHGTIIGVARVARDITSRQQADEVRARLAAIVQSSDDAIVGKTLDGIITSWNPGAERLFGYSEAEVVGQRIFLIVPEDRWAEEEGVLARLRRGERIDHFETIRQAKDGSRIPISLTVSPIRDERGTIIGASKVARDVTVAQQRDELRARLAAIVHSSDDAIVSKTLDGVITSWNPAAERLFGYSEAEAVGQRIFLIIPEDRWAEEEDVLVRLRGGERIDHFETVRQAKDGRRIPISLTVSPLRDERGNVIGASKVARDISERHRAQEALRRAHDELEDRVRQRTAELREEMDQRRRVEQERIELLTRLLLAQEDERQRIARDLHDQLGQHLTALRLTLETLGSESVERPDIRTQVETLQELARQLDQDVAFRVRGLRSTVLESAGLAGALRDYVDNWSNHFGVAVQLHTNALAHERLPAEVETMMYRLVQEALNNVIKHARADHVDVVLERGAESVSLIVEDNGIGFDPSRALGAGHGLGLTGMRERSALVRGDLQVESTPGKGTTIFVRVPVRPSPLNQR